MPRAIYIANESNGRFPRPALDKPRTYLIGDIGKAGVPYVSPTDLRYINSYVLRAPAALRPSLRFVYSNPFGRVLDLLILQPPAQRELKAAGPGSYVLSKVLNAPCNVQYDERTDESGPTSAANC
jgi:hypothetical protein